jgi:galactosamine-6-phosphate isomerase
MNISYYLTYDELSEGGCKLIMKEIRQKQTILLCAATGGSPKGVYKKLAKEYRESKHLFQNLRILKLDEWGGIPMSNPNSCQSYLNDYLLKPLEIGNDRFISFNSEAVDPALECLHIQDKINKVGPIDICVLGLGLNGHLGFNEPENFSANCHVAKLSSQTLQHSMTLSMPNKPTFGMTIGMNDILNAKKIILLITGKGKREVINKLLSKKINRQLPASFLWLHQQVECLIDKSSWHS